jgi:stearoyl-CoA desaturase (delta-9 desaturase)
MRFWLWLTTGMITKEWVAVHRKHHQKTDVEGDPHSPHREGIWSILFSGVYYYIQTSKDRDMVQKYGVGTPDDWIEKNIYSKFPYAGITLLLLINLLCFSWWGIWVWAVQMIWIPFWAAGVINGLGHYYGYRNYDSKDKSTNILPWGIIIGGEELHNNHHGDVGNPKLSRKWLEFDIGWMWLSLLRKLKLAKLRNEGNT